MKNWIFSLVILTSIIVGPVGAAEKDPREVEVEIEMRITPRHYTFQNYLSDLQESTRVTDIDPTNPVRQLEALRTSKYEPLNPLVLFRW